ACCPPRPPAASRATRPARSSPPSSPVPPPHRPRRPSAYRTLFGALTEVLLGHKQQRRSIRTTRVLLRATHRSDRLLRRRLVQPTGRTTHRRTRASRHPGNRALVCAHTEDLLGHKQQRRSIRPTRDQ